MNISFDLDDTLIIHNSLKHRNEKLLNGEYLRNGTIQLLKKLSKHHKIFIYTTSFRNPILVKLLFKLKGINIEKVINQSIHIEQMHKMKLENFPSKLPTAFGINLHIDDSQGVLYEGENFNFKTLIIDNDNENWDDEILKYVSTCVAGLKN